MSRLFEWLSGHRAQRRRPEDDVPLETSVGWSRETGGDPESEAYDQARTTGTAPSGGYVGRVASDDGDHGESGAERRAEADRDR